MTGVDGCRVQILKKRKYAKARKGMLILPKVGKMVLPLKSYCAWIIVGLWLV